MRIFAFVILFSLCCTIKAAAECECEYTDLAAIANATDRIIYGTISSATLVDNQVNFTLDVIDTIRGSDNQHVYLSTAVQPSCGVPIVVGTHEVFFLYKNFNFVNRCNATDRKRRWEAIAMIPALHLAQYSGGDPQEIISKVAGGLAGAHSEERIIELLRIVSTLKPYGTGFERMEGGISYRDIKIVIKDGKYVGIHPASP